MATAELETDPGLRTEPLPVEPHWLRVAARGDVGVDREAKVLRGYVVVQEGVLMEPDPRGEFDHKSLRAVVTLMKANPNGTKSRFGHPTLSDDGLGKFLGRALNPRLDKVSVKRGGETVELEAVRADLHLSDTAFEGNPNGNLGEYVLSLAEKDPGAFATSMVLEWEEELRLDAKGRAKTDDAGVPLPALLRPVRIHASDVVDTGAAVDAMLSPAGLPDEIVRRGAELLDRQFAGASREVVEARCLAWLDRYLSHRFGPKDRPSWLDVELAIRRLEDE